MTGIIGIIKSKNFVFSLFLLNNSSFTAYTKVTTSLMSLELLIKIFNSRSFIKTSTASSNLSISSIKLFVFLSFQRSIVVHQYAY